MSEDEIRALDELRQEYAWSDRLSGACDAGLVLAVCEENEMTAADVRGGAKLYDVNNPDSPIKTILLEAMERVALRIESRE